MVLFAFAIAVVLIYSVFVEPFLIQVSYHEIPLEGLPPAFDGFRIVQLTDIHANKVWTTPHFLAKAVSITNRQKPDVVVLTGDFVRQNLTDIELLSVLGDIKSKHGVYAVLGNHDYWLDPEAVVRVLKKEGIKVLFDEHCSIARETNVIKLVGFDDLWEGMPDYDKALKGVQDEDVCIAIAHNPDAILKLKNQPVDLLITGHTHGGLVNLPIVGPLVCPTQLGTAYASGLFKFGNTYMYVCRGIGSGVVSHIRFNCRPEIAVLVLRKSN